jgi:hypothetical protein
MGRTDCPISPISGQVDSPCTIILAGNASTGSVPVNIELAGVIATEDGGTYFLDFTARRFLNDIRDAIQNGVPAPIFGSNPAVFLSPSPAPGVTPTTLLFPFPAPNDPTPVGTKIQQYWFNAGVTTTNGWRVIWHAVFPGLESVGGALSRPSPTGTVHFQTPGKTLSPWTNSPTLHLAAGDVVRVLALGLLNNGQTPCSELLSVLVTQEIPIASVGPDSFELQPLPGIFDPPASCFAQGTVPMVIEVRTGSSPSGPGAWMVFENFDVRGRVAHGQQFVVYSQRFDYPLDYTPSTDPKVASPPLPLPVDIETAFTPSGPEPTIPGTKFLFTTANGSSYTSFRDPSVTQGFAGPVVVYTSPKFVNPLLFVSITGGNELLQADPGLLGVSGTLIAYH